MANEWCATSVPLPATNAPLTTNVANCHLIRSSRLMLLNPRSVGRESQPRLRTCQLDTNTAWTDNQPKREQRLCDAGGRAGNGELCGSISHLLVIFRSRHRPSSTMTAQLVDWPQAQSPTNLAAGPWGRPELFWFRLRWRRRASYADEIDIS